MPSPTYLFTLLEVFLAWTCDRLISSLDRSGHDLLVSKTLINSVAHFTIAILTRLIIVWYSDLKFDHKLVDVISSGMLSVLLDLDSYISYLFGWKDSPPFFHRYSSVVLFVCILCMTLSWGLRKDPELDRMSSIVWRVSSHIFGALATHLIRDARLGGLCLWPDSTELSLPYLVYIASIAGIPYALRSKHHSRRPPGQRYDLLQTA